MPFALETASHPENLKRVAIEPVSRVEGHGKVTLLLDDDNHVQQVRLHITEFRGFEKFIEGRPYWEVPVMVQRLCGICPVSHHLAASKAMDMIVGATLTPTAEKIRRLMHYGQILQSHALHFFHLSSPDLLFGFDSDVAHRNIVGVIAAHPDIAKKGVLLRKYGQEIIRMTAGKRVHGTGSIPGGVNKSLTAEERATLQKDIYQMIAWSRDAVNLIKQLFEQHLEFYNSFGRISAHNMGLVRADGAMDLYHGGLRARRADGSTLFDHFDYSRYWDVISEDVKSWSYMKFPFFNAMGSSDTGWYRVGPLTRVTQCDFIPTPLADKERSEFMAFDNGSATGATLGYHWARMIEMLHAAEVIKDLLHDDDVCGKELMSSGKRQERGVGVIEAPRGTLIHHYRVDEHDQVIRANLIVSTTHNNQAMNEAIRVVAKQYLDGRELTEGLLNHIEVAIRCFDPCLSCATHALGKMPLEVELIGADGTAIDRMTRNMNDSCPRS
ncbi:MAG: Ni/Fe hydrogenase subunit alpha [Gammaproteobacteria bacterium]|nr:Ni/Fe hydrogenase subunit alpha [Rhodocyclaceae bacterium]MBU3909728.1 Ni/Fe hydrogenase subunit alpha [Gammaproteobacteria bacterium]MBU3990556.1 Ni/Fe hydrogenase subunit alpha [Gammaproteobacteria bacterium]MBU4005261.1 Ni/Fe hydrogenase subunit alpha [Gammaproteobacteria bacterium]MBU4022439.1 Ni/Fe hydrogenase subunit alpha [Gammaproteobacteria bacterium]